MKPKITERGWAGHFCCADRCNFRRNTLIEYDDIKIVVSTVGLMRSFDKENKFEEIGLDRYYETMAFHAHNHGFYDADVSLQINFNSQWSIGSVDAEIEANIMHDKVVKEIASRLKKGDKFKVEKYGSY
jgi:hypothetical protein